MPSQEELVRELLERVAMADVIHQLAKIALEGDTDKMIAMGHILSALTAQSLWDYP